MIATTQLHHELQKIIRQGDEGSEFFVIVDGEAEVSVHGQGVVFTCASTTTIRAMDGMGDCGSVRVLCSLPPPRTVMS